MNNGRLRQSQVKPLLCQTVRGNHFLKILGRNGMEGGHVLSNDPASSKRGGEADVGDGTCSLPRLESIVEFGG